MPDLHRGYVGPLEWDVSDRDALTTLQVAFYPVGTRGVLDWRPLEKVGAERVDAQTGMRTQTVRCEVAGPSSTDAERAAVPGVIVLPTFGRYANAVRVQAANGWRLVGPGEVVTFVA